MIEDNSIPEPNSGCYLWLGAKTKKGYGNIMYRDAYGRRHWTSPHKRRWEESNGAVPDGYQVRHKCGKRLCVNLDHLAIGTQSDNEQDKKRHGMFRHYGDTAPRVGNRWVSRGDNLSH